MIARVKTWGSKGGLQYRNLKLRPCTSEELGIDSSGEVSEDTKFYPVHKNSVQWLEQYWKKLKCYDEEVDIHGNYNSVDASHLHFSFTRCNPEKRSTCVGDEEFEKFTE